MKSLKQKSIEAFVLANKICDLIDEGKLSNFDDNLEYVYPYADGLRHNFFIRVINGWCSLQTVIDFDMGKEEANLDSDIKRMKNVLSSSL